MALCLGLLGCASTRSIYSPLSWSSTILYQLPASAMMHSILPVHFTCLTLFLHNLSKSSLVCLLVWNPALHTPYIFSPNHWLLFAAHVHTITTCFAVVPGLCHLILVSFSTPNLELSYTLTSHIYLTIFNSACWSATSFSFVTGQVSFPCNIRLCTQLLHSLTLTQQQLQQLFNGKLFGTTRWAGIRKVKPIWIHWSKRQWVAVAPAGPYANLYLCLLYTSDAADE